MLVVVVVCVSLVIVVCWLLRVVVSYGWLLRVGCWLLCVVCCAYCVSFVVRSSSWLFVVWFRFVVAVCGLSSIAVFSLFVVCCVLLALVFFWFARGCRCWLFVV